MVDQVAGRQPVNGGVEDGHHHPAGKSLLLPQAVQVTVAHLKKVQVFIISSAQVLIHRSTATVIWILIGSQTGVQGPTEGLDGMPGGPQQNEVKLKFTFI